MKEFARFAEVVDTSTHRPHMRSSNSNDFRLTGKEPHAVHFDFGHIFGAPRDMELMFDVRHLPILFSLTVA